MITMVVAKLEHQHKACITYMKENTESFNKLPSYTCNNEGHRFGEDRACVSVLTLLLIELVCKRMHACGTLFVYVCLQIVRQAVCRKQRNVCMQ